MTDFTIRVAGQNVAVLARFETSRRFCEKYLREGEPDFTVAISQNDIEYEREKSAQEDVREGLPVRNLPDAYLETIAIQRKITHQLFTCDTLLFHGSVVAVDGAAYIFTAKSGTGKSTHTRLWREMLGDRAMMVNDDKPFLVIKKGKVLAYGTPWSGKHRLDTNTAVPVKAVCILERGADNTIAPIPARDALAMLFQQSCRPEDPGLMPKYMDLIDGLARNVALYRLQCNMEPDAARVSYEAMSGEKMQ